MCGVQTTGEQDLQTLCGVKIPKLLTLFVERYGIFWVIFPLGLAALMLLPKRYHFFVYFFAINWREIIKTSCN